MPEWEGEQSYDSHAIYFICLFYFISFWGGKEFLLSEKKKEKNQNKTKNTHTHTSERINELTALFSLFTIVQLRTTLLALADLYYYFTIVQLKTTLLVLADLYYFFHSAVDVAEGFSGGGG